MPQLLVLCVRRVARACSVCVQRTCSVYLQQVSVITNGLSKIGTGRQAARIPCIRNIKKKEEMKKEVFDLRFFSLHTRFAIDLVLRTTTRQSMQKSVSRIVRVFLRFVPVKAQVIVRASEGRSVLMYRGGVAIKRTIDRVCASRAWPG